MPQCIQNTNRRRREKNNGNYSIILIFVSITKKPNLLICIKESSYLSRCGCRKDEKSILVSCKFLYFNNIQFNKNH